MKPVKSLRKLGALVVFLVCSYTALCSVFGRLAIAGVAHQKVDPYKVYESELMGHSRMHAVHAHGYVLGHSNAYQRKPLPPEPYHSQLAMEHSAVYDQRYTDAVRWSSGYGYSGYEHAHSYHSRPYHSRPFAGYASYGQNNVASIYSKYSESRYSEKKSRVKENHQQKHIADYLHTATGLNHGERQNSPVASSVLVAGWDVLTGNGNYRHQGVGAGYGMHAEKYGTPYGEHNGYGYGHGQQQEGQQQETQTQVSTARLMAVRQKLDFLTKIGAVPQSYGVTIPIHARRYYHEGGKANK